jgi:phage protein U
MVSVGVLKRSRHHQWLPGHRVEVEVAVKYVSKGKAAMTISGSRDRELVTMKEKLRNVRTLTMKIRGYRLKRHYWDECGRVGRYMTRVKALEHE